MNIKFRNYQLTPATGVEDRFDLQETVNATVKGDKKRIDGRKKGDKYVTQRDVAYGLKLEEGLQKIILFCVAEKKETSDIKGFLEEYKSVKNELFKLLED